MSSAQVSAPGGIRAYRLFPPRPLSEWMDDGAVPAGHEAGGLLFPPYVVDAIAACRSRGLPEMYAVTGEERHPDGRSFLSFGVTRAYIEAVGDHRDDGRGLRWRCPVCARGADAKHANCDRGAR